MADHDNQKDYWEQVRRWGERKRAERKANENHSKFTIMSMVGFALGTGIFYHTPYVVLGIAALTAIGALLGAGIDYCQCNARKRTK